MSEPQSPSVTPAAHMAAELASQPETWAEAASMTAEQALLPAAGTRIAVVGCGTSWFMAQSYAWLRETGGQGETDAFAASEAFVDRGYDAVVALTRSGTTTEVLELVERLRGRVRTVGVIGDPTSPLVDLVDDAVTLPFADEQSVVQTRFATTALALFRASLGEDLDGAVADARRAIDGDLDPALVDAEQFTFLGRGWTVGLAHEAALKMREASQSWTESYPAMEYRHGPISIAAPGRVTWHFGAPPAGLAAEVAATGRALRGGHARPDGRARARPARRPRQGAGPGPRPRCAAQPHPLRHPRGLTDVTTTPDAAPAPLGPGEVVLAFDVGGTDTKSAIVDADGRVLGVTRTPTPLDGERTAEAVVAHVAELAAGLRDAHPGLQPVAAGLLVPGIVDAERGVGVYASNLGWRDAPIRDLAEAALGLPVAFHHDVTAASWAEHRLGAARAYDDVVVLVIGTGIAGSLILDGRPHLGGGYAGEIGHSPVADGPQCPCGAWGCLEAVASAGAIVRRYAERTGESVAGAREVLALARGGRSRRRRRVGGRARRPGLRGGPARGDRRARGDRDRRRALPCGRRPLRTAHVAHERTTQLPPPPAARARAARAGRRAARRRPHRPRARRRGLRRRAGDSVDEGVGA